MKNNTQYKNDFIQNNYDRINFTVPKGAKEKIKEHCDSLGLSVNSYIYSLILKDIPSLLSKRAEEEREMDVFLL